VGTLWRYDNRDHWRRCSAARQPAIADNWCTALGSFFFNGFATTEISPLSLHDALPIYAILFADTGGEKDETYAFLPLMQKGVRLDRKSTRLNSSHLGTSYAVFCLKKKKPRSCSHWSSLHPYLLTRVTYHYRCLEQLHHP